MKRRLTGYSGDLVDPPARRIAWADFQIDLDRVRDASADLDRISGLVNLSIPERSTFRRAVHGYDVPAAETAHTRLSGSILSDDSGVRVQDDGPKWSFGRSYSFEHSITEAELIALGIWIPEIVSQKWADMDFPWVTANFKWSDDAERGRRVSLASGLQAVPVWLRFSDADGGTIGFRRAVCHGVEIALEGYPFGADFLRPSLENPIGVYVFARTGFGDGSGTEAAGVSLLFGGTVSNAAKPGQLWLDAAGVSGGTEVAPQQIDIPFGEAVREQVQFLMRF